MNPPPPNCGHVAEAWVLSGLEARAEFTKYLTIYRKFIVRSTYGSDLESAKKFKEYRKLICEHCLRRSYNFASESYLRKALRPS